MQRTIKLDESKCEFSTATSDARGDTKRHERGRKETFDIDWHTIECKVAICTSCLWYSQWIFIYALAILWSVRFQVSFIYLLLFIISYEWWTIVWCSTFDWQPNCTHGTNWMIRLLKNKRFRTFKNAIGICENSIFFLLHKRIKWWSLFRTILINQWLHLILLDNQIPAFRQSIKSMLHKSTQYMITIFIVLF